MDPYQLRDAALAVKVPLLGFVFGISARNIAMSKETPVVFAWAFGLLALIVVNEVAKLRHAGPDFRRIGFVGLFTAGWTAGNFVDTWGPYVQHFMDKRV